MRGSREAPEGWDRYVASFHRRRPGITEALLARSVDLDGRNPYQWIADDLDGGRVVDIGCGSGPTYSPSRSWIGLDRSPEELNVARARSRGPVVTGRAEALPFAARAADTVLMVMMLMVASHPRAVVAEIVRILRVGGQLRVLVPAAGPLRTADRFRYAGLLAILGRATVPFPRRDAVRDPRALLEAQGFHIADDERRCFSFPLAEHGGSDRLIDGLYLPGVGARRQRAARAWLQAGRPAALGIPLRRLTARLQR